MSSAKFAFGAILALVLLGGCKLAPRPAPSVSTATLSSAERALTEAEIATLNSLVQVDNFPLYTMQYVGDYPSPVLIGAANPLRAESALLEPIEAPIPWWGCALFATLGDPDQRLYGRNFDWRFSPAVLLFTDPPDGYASVSMVDIDYLGFAGERAEKLLDLPLSERQALLDAPAWPFDGMNEQGLAIGMAAVPPGEMKRDSSKQTIDQLAVMREILDHAGTVDEAIKILGGYNIDMGSVPVHYLIAGAAGESALVEFYQGKMIVFRNKEPWQLATNFLVAASGGLTQGQCPRYDRISQRLQTTAGKLTVEEALDLLSDVSQGSAQAQTSTQWSLVYDMTGRDIHIIMGQKFGEGAHTLRLR